MTPTMGPAQLRSPRVSRPGVQAITQRQKVPMRNCVFLTAALKADRTADQHSFRNIYQYLDDCYIQGVSPSLPQLLILLHSAEVSLAFPGPGWIARPLSYAFGVVVGEIFGKYVLGYKASYAEYYDESKESRKTK
jgi:hypothetical protein